MSRRFYELVVVILAAASLALTAPAASQSGVPTFAQANGFEIGERLVRHRDAKHYLEVLAETSDRVSIETLGHSWERRELILATVTSPQNLGRLEEVLANNRRLDDARTLDGKDVPALIENHPVTVLYTGTIHGFELSPTEGLMRLLERLATQNDAETLEVLDNAIVLIQPIINPDGRDAFVNENHARIGATPNPSRSDWNNDYSSFEALRYRTTHYFFDANRDWFANTQPETRAVAAAIRKYRPQVAVDVHEMGTDNSFYFDPPAPPFGLTPKYALDWYERFGEAHARAFDRAGFEYFGRDFYNYFYPGYSEAYNNLQGAVGMLYEQGAPRGLAIDRSDGSVLTMVDAASHQYTAAWASLRLAVEERAQLLFDYRKSSEAALADAQGSRYFVRSGGDPGLIHELGELLLRHGIEVSRMDEDLTVEAARDRYGNPLTIESVPTGSLVIDASQPRSALLRSLLEPDLPMEEEFLELAREKIDRDLNPRFYDVTAWSLPLLYDVDLINATVDSSPASTALEANSPRPLRRPATDAAYAYILPGGQAASRAAAWHLRRQGYRLSFLAGATEIDGLTIESGSIVIRVGQNDDTLHEAVRQMADRYLLDLDVVTTGWSPAGKLNLGAPDVTVPLAESNIALVTEDPIFALSFGFAWHKLDQQYGIPTTVVRARSLGRTDLSEFDVLVLPEVLDLDELDALLGDSGKARLETWIRDGGALVALGSAVEFVRKNLDLIDLESWYDKDAPDEAEKNESDGEEQPTEAAGPDLRHFDVPGAVYEAKLDTWQWLAAGYDDSMPFLITSDRLYRAPGGPPKSENRVVAAIAEGMDLGAGFAWPESRERLPGSVLLYEQRVGSGRIISFAEDPNFRGLWRGADRLFLNAVVVGPSAP